MPSPLQRDLERELAGEVRFDAVSRALYSTDASVYQIIPLGVVVPRGDDDVVRAVQIAGRHGVSITARGGGTSQAGQAVGAGLPPDTSKYPHRVVDGDVPGRTAGGPPGGGLDEVKGQAAAHGLP